MGYSYIYIIILEFIIWTSEENDWLFVCFSDSQCVCVCVCVGGGELDRQH